MIKRIGHRHYQPTVLTLHRNQTVLADHLGRNHRQHVPVDGAILQRHCIQSGLLDQRLQQTTIADRLVVTQYLPQLVTRCLLRLKCSLKLCGCDMVAFTQ